MVKAGDSLWKIARDNGISMPLLLQSNPDLESQNLQIGTKIILPRRVEGRVVQTDEEYSFDSFQRDLAALIDIYPFIEVHSIGESVMGKPLYDIRIGKGLTEVFFNAGMHANEWITCAAAMNLINDYLIGLTNSGSLLGEPLLPYYSSHTVSFVPMINPDGVDLVVYNGNIEEPYRSEALAINSGNEDFSGWKANIRGVDLNKQFPALWEVDAVVGPQEPAPRDYSGTAPLTEPEVIALADLTRARDFDRVVALHTQGEEIYYGFENLEPPESETYAANMAKQTGYTAIRNVDSRAGYKDWFIQDWRRPGFTIELGLGVNPLPLEQLSQITEDLHGIFAVALQNY